jgi:hypothetical protein
MEHTEATESMAAERYLLGEMTPEDRDAFEEHFFGCGACASDVRDGARIGASIRTEKANRTRQPRRIVALQWVVAAAAAMVLAGVPVVQNVALRQQLAAARQPHVADFISFLSAGSRGETLPVQTAARLPFTIEFEIQPQTGATQYIVEVVGAGGKVWSRDVVPAKSAGDTQHRVFPGGSLPPGRYQLEVHAEPAGSPATTWSFVVR